MSIVQGKNAILFFKIDGYYGLIGCMDSWNLTTTTELKETSTVQTGTSRTFRGDRNTYSINCTGLVSFDENIPHVKLRQLQQTFTVVPISIVETDDNGIVSTFLGSVLVTSIANDAAAGDFDKYTIQASGTGDWTITDIPVDPNECCQDAWIYYTGRGSEGNSITLPALIGRVIAGRLYRDGIEYRPSGAEYDGKGTPIGKQFKYDITTGKISFDVNLVTIAAGEPIDIPYNLCTSTASCDIVINNVIPVIAEIESGSSSTLEISQQGTIDAKNAFFTLKGVPVEGDSVSVQFSLDQIVGVDLPYLHIVSQTNPDGLNYTAEFAGNGSIYHTINVAGSFDGTNYNVTSDSGFSNADNIINNVISKLNTAGITAVRNDVSPNIGFKITGISSVSGSGSVIVSGITPASHEVNSTVAVGQNIDDLVNDLLTKIQLINAASISYTDTDSNKGIQIRGYSTATIDSVTITQAQDSVSRFKITFQPEINSVLTAPDDVSIRYSTDQGTTWSVPTSISYNPDVNYQLVVINDALDISKTYLFEVTPVCNGAKGTPGTGSYVGCTPVVIGSYSLPDAIDGHLYDVLIPVTGTSPITLTNKVYPGWITTFDVEGSNVHLSGTPAHGDISTGVTISFTAHNCGSSSDAFTGTMNVMANPSNTNITDNRTDLDVEDLIFNGSTATPYSTYPIATAGGGTGTASIPPDISSTITVRFSTTPASAIHLEIQINGIVQEIKTISSPVSIIITSDNTYTINTGDTVSLTVY